MGYPTYSSSARTVRADTLGYMTKSSNEIFKERSINNAMSPYGVKLRESRDSIEHPNSVPIIIALDVTGSMGTVPHHLIKTGLPDIMESIISSGIKDPQILFLAIGDHEGDRSPLQVGQFESSDDLLDKWLTTVWLEGGGGGNDGESYMLAWYFAKYHTEIDSLDKRNKKGYLFTIGDEPVLNSIPERVLKRIMGNGQYQTFKSEDLLAGAGEKYNTFHIHIKETHSGSRKYVMDGWKQLMSDNLLIADRHDQVAGLIADIVLEGESVIDDAADTTIVDEKERVNFDDIML